MSQVGVLGRVRANPGRAGKPLRALSLQDSSTPLGQGGLQGRAGGGGGPLDPLHLRVGDVLSCLRATLGKSCVGGSKAAAGAEVLQVSACGLSGSAVCLCLCVVSDVPGDRLRMLISTMLYLILCATPRSYHQPIWVSDVPARHTNLPDKCTGCCTVGMHHRHHTWQCHDFCGCRG